ncbi:MAG: hypothetical protein JST19_11785 [Bacteroidetes bacterium]|nr:hypothetical protein [Bacteroidota bacterium]
MTRMVISNASFYPKKLKYFADWKLLLFLVLFMDVKLGIKVAAIVLAYILQFNLKFGFSFKNSRLPLFYPLAIAIALFNWLIGMNYGYLNYDLVLLTAIGFWILCILAMHQVKLSVEQHDTETIHRTLVLFFILNAAFSLANLAVIIFKTGYIDPYTYQGEHQKYFIGTGDYIKGLTFDTSTTNSVLNAFGVFYFLDKKNMPMLFLCMIIMLLTGSNFINIILLVLLTGIFIFRSSRDQKSLITACMMFMIVFMVKVSPQNYMYAHEVIKNNFFPQPIHTVPPPRELPYITLRADSTLTPNERKQKHAIQYLDSVYVVKHPEVLKKTPANAPLKTPAGRIYMPIPNINTTPYQHVAETTAYQKQLLVFIGEHKRALPLAGAEKEIHKPGKEIGLLQTIGFLRAHPFKILTGDGAGNFSSKLAYRVGGMDFAGGYPQKLTYLSPDFLSNHLDVYLNFFSKKSDYHSLINNPGSVYDQLLSEYGLIGVAGFLVWYLGYFLKHYLKLTYGIPIILLLLAVLFIDYWFEQLSILLLFELFLLLNIKESSTNKTPVYAN